MAWIVAHGRRNVLRLVALLVMLTVPLAVQAQTAPQPSSEEARRQESRAAWKAAVEAGTKGPADVPLLDEAALHLPRDMLFFPPAQAARLLRAWGNRVAVEPVGLLVGTGPQDDWSIVIRYTKEGYIKDDDAKDWNAKELLDSLREGNEASNEDRRTRGFPELEVVGWVAPPAYDAAAHRLVWSLAQKRKGDPDSVPRGVNYNTYALGRQGYFSLNLLTNSQDVEHDKAAATAALAGLDYKPGHRYTDFNASTDHVAEYGLAALVGVVAAKKLGFLALIGVFALKFAKIGAVGVAIVAGLGAKLFRRKPKPTA